MTVKIDMTQNRPFPHYTPVSKPIHMTALSAVRKWRNTQKKKFKRTLSQNEEPFRSENLYKY